MAIFYSDLVNGAPPISLIGPRALTTSVTGATQDLIQRDGPCAAFLIVGDASGTGSPVLDVTLQESTDGTTWTQCYSEAGVTGGTFSQVAGTTGGVSQGIFVQRTARYMRAVNVVGGTTSPSFTATVLLFEVKKQL